MAADARKVTAARQERSRWWSFVSIVITGGAAVGSKQWLEWISLGLGLRETGHRSAGVIREMLGCFGPKLLGRLAREPARASSQTGSLL